MEKYFASRSLRNHSVQFDFVSHGKYLRPAMADHWMCRRGPRRQRFLYDQGRSGVVLGSRDGRHGATSRFYRRVRRPWHRAAASQVRSKEGEINPCGLIRPSRNGLASRCPPMAGRRKSPSRHKASEKTFLLNILAAAEQPHAQRKICMLPG